MVPAAQISGNKASLLPETSLLAYLQEWDTCRIAQNRCNQIHATRWPSNGTNIGLRA
jgi:hypothetical protein